MVKILENNSGFSQWMKNQNAAAPKKKGGFLWWTILFLGAWLLFSGFFGDKEKSEIRNHKSEIIEDVSSVPVSGVANDKISATARGLRISDINLSGYDVSLLAGENEFVQVGLIASGTTAPTATTPWRAPRKVGAPQLWRNADGIDFARTITAENYVITVRDEIKNNSSRDVSFAPYARIVRGAGEDAASVETGAVSYIDDDLEYESFGRLNKKSFAYQTNSGFAGFADQYWETIANIGAENQTVVVKKSGDKYQSDINAAAVNVAAGGVAVFETKVFAGPRDLKILDTAGIAGLSDTVDYGWFWFLSQPMLWVMNAMYDFIGNYGVAIILLTVILRILMWPLTRKSYTSMAAMQKMQPQLQRIQKLYANDKARLQMEMMRLYQSHKTSPMSGCLPMILQIPIFFALYKALLISVPMRNAGFLWVSDLAAMDPYFILPILMGATMWWQQKLQSTSPSAQSQNDPAAQMQKFMKWMPWIFTLMFAWMPAGLVLYWVVSNLFGIGQMWLIKRKS